MREIKFRAWHKDNKSFVFRSLAGFWRNGWLCCSHTFPFVEMSQPNEENSFSLNGEWEQFTGLLDKNGNEIYEGDVIRCALMFEGVSLPHMGEVVRDDKHGCWSTKNHAGLTPFLKHELIASREIIGNIHENPKLLGNT